MRLINCENGWQRVKEIVKYITNPTTKIPNKVLKVNKNSAIKRKYAKEKVKNQNKT